MTAAISGVLIFLMIMMSIANDVIGSSIDGWPHWVSGFFGWVAAALLIGTVSVSQRIQTGIIAAVGLLLIGVAYQHGAVIDVQAAIGNNASLISMIAAVGFLRLVTLARTASNEALPIGPLAYYKTLLGVSLFGSVINISAPIIFADRLSAKSALDRLTSQSITRIFSGCSAWSPFFGGMAVVITYVPALSLPLVMTICFPFAVVGFFIVCFEARFRYNDQLQTFKGYPVKYSSLWVPAALAVTVIVLSNLAPLWSVLTCISLGALALTLTVLVQRHGISAGFSFVWTQITGYLPKMVNELVLFLVAGVLAAGLASVISTGLVTVPFPDFHATEAVALLALMIMLAVIGVHPVVTVSGATPLLSTLDPNANLLAVTYLFAWSLGTSASPLSGTHLVFQGRYSVPSWKGASWNWPFVFVMFLVAVPVLWLVDTFL